MSLYGLIVLNPSIVSLELHLVCMLTKIQTFLVKLKWCSLNVSLELKLSGLRVTPTRLETELLIIFVELLQSSEYNSGN